MIRFPSAFVFAVLAALCVASAARADKPKFGRIIWTELNRTGRWTGTPPDMKIVTKAFHPSPPKAPRDKDFGLPSGLWLSQDATNPLQVGRMHPVFDFLGMGFLCGTGPGVKLTPGTGPAAKGSISVDGRLSSFKLKVESDKAELDKELPMSQAGAGSFFYPSASRNGRTAYASKISISPQDGIVYDLFSFDLTQLSPTQTPTPVDLKRRGAYPAISPNGDLLAFLDRTDNGLNQLVVAKVSDLNTPVGVITAPQDRRIVRPTWRGDSKAIAFSSDFAGSAVPTKDSWQIWAIRLDQMTATPQAFDTAGATPITVDGQGAPRGPDGTSVWPSWSQDGKYIAYSFKPANGAKYDVYVAEVDPKDITPKGDPVKISDSSPDGFDEMWASINEDLNPPCLRVELVPTDSGQPNVLTLASFDESVGTAAGADSQPLAGTAFFSAKGTHFQRGMATPIGAAATPPTTVPVPFTRDWVQSGDFGVYLGLHVGAKIPYANQGASKQLLTNVPTVAQLAAPYATIQGFYVNKDARVVVKVSAKDNQWRRMYPGTPGANLGETPWAFPEQDGRALAPGYAPPYLPLMNRQNVLDGEPGVAWWWEDDQFNVLGGENVDEFVPRFGNFENDEDAAKPKMVYFRAMANDLWRNRTEITMPVFVYTKEVDLRVLNFDGAKKDGQKQGGK